MGDNKQLSLPHNDNNAPENGDEKLFYRSVGGRGCSARFLEESWGEGRGFPAVFAVENICCS